jgi:hypothetical protein
MAAKATKDKAGGDVVPLRPARPCPICGNPSARDAYPFCSKRCANIDLNRWLSGSYAIPSTEEGPSSGAGEGDDEDR